MKKTLLILVIIVVTLFIIAGLVYLFGGKVTKEEPEEKPVEDEIVTQIDVNIPPEAMADLQERLAKAEEAVKSDPNNYDNYFNLGHVKEVMGDLTGARDAYIRALEIKADPVCLLNLGEVYIKMKDYKMAEQTFQEVINLYPGDESGYLRLGELWQYNFPEKSSDEIIVLYKEGMETSLYRSANLELRLATYCEEIEDYEQAKFYYEELLKVYPDNEMYKAKVEELSEKLEL